MSPNFRFIVNAAQRIRTNFLLVARATDLAIDVFPTPGGPTRHNIEPLFFLTSDCTAKIFDNTFLNILQSEMIFIQNRLGFLQRKFIFPFFPTRACPVSSQYNFLTTVASADMGVIICNFLISCRTFFTASSDIFFCFKRFPDHLSRS